MTTPQRQAESVVPLITLLQPFNDRCPLRAETATYSTDPSVPELIQLQDAYLLVAAIHEGV